MACSRPIVPDTVRPMPVGSRRDVTSTSGAPAAAAPGSTTQRSNVDAAQPRATPAGFARLQQAVAQRKLTQAQGGGDSPSSSNAPESARSDIKQAHTAVSTPPPGPPITPSTASQSHRVRTACQTDSLRRLASASPIQAGCELPRWAVGLHCCLINDHDLASS